MYDDNAAKIIYVMAMAALVLMVAALAFGCATVTTEYPDGRVERRTSLDVTGVRAVLSEAPTTAEALREIRDALHEQDDAPEADDTLDKIDRALTLLERLQRAKELYVNEELSRTP